MKIYCDTCIYMDYFFGRKDNLRPLDEFAYQVFRRVELGEFNLIISDHLLYELSHNVEESKITDLLKPLNEKGQIIKVYKTSEDILKAKTISKENWKDVLHAILANKAKAVYLVTRNLQDYEGCQDLVEIKLPEYI